MGGTDTKLKVQLLVVLTFGMVPLMIVKPTQQMQVMWHSLLGTLRGKESTLNGISLIAFPMSMNFGDGLKMAAAQHLVEFLSRKPLKPMNLAGTGKYLKAI